MTPLKTIPTARTEGRSRNGPVWKRDGPTTSANPNSDAVNELEKKLKLAKLGEDAGWVEYRSGASSLIIYHVDDVEGAFAELKASGIRSFQHYDELPGTTRSGDIHEAGPVKMAWFTDPSGNIFEINGRE